jgi:hypothetical protein
MSRPTRSNHCAEICGDEALPPLTRLLYSAVFHQNAGVLKTKEENDLHRGVRL